MRAPAHQALRSPEQPPSVLSFRRPLADGAAVTVHVAWFPLARAAVRVVALTREHVLALACDGRHAEEAGLTLGELADALVGLGAHAAINLDGGGSASLVCRGELVNRPREQHGIELLEGRPIATAVVLAMR